MTTALLLLASGLSRRFGRQDKLLARYAGTTLLHHTAQIGKDLDLMRFAVIGAQDAKKAEILRPPGFTIILNPAPAEGQGSAIAAAFKSIQTYPQISRAIVILADMPFIDDAHLKALIAASDTGATAVSSRNGPVLCPPVLFSKAQFQSLANLRGDGGAKSVFYALGGTRTVELPRHKAVDIDTPDDLRRARDIANSDPSPG